MKECTCGIKRNPNCQVHVKSYIHPDNKDWVIEDQRDDIRMLLVYANRVLQHKDSKVTLDRELSFDCLKSAIRYLTEKYDMKKLIERRCQ